MELIQMFLAAIISLYGYRFAHVDEHHYGEISWAGKIQQGKRSAVQIPIHDGVCGSVLYLPNRYHKENEARCTNAFRNVGD